MSILNGPYHPILERPWEYEMFTLQYWRPTAESEPFIDITLKDGNGFRNLRFLTRKTLKFIKGFPLKPTFAFSMYLTEVSSGSTCVLII
jgi:hypothetical protein